MQVPLEGTAAGSWSLGIVERSQGEGCCFLQKRRWRGGEGGDCGGKCLWRKTRQPWRQGNTAALCIGGTATTVTSLMSPWTISLKSIADLTLGLLHNPYAPPPNYCASRGPTSLSGVHMVVASVLCVILILFRLSLISYFMLSLKCFSSVSIAPLWGSDPCFSSSTCQGQVQSH